MPALGKSGTSPTLLFKSSMGCVLPDIEAGFNAGRAGVAHFDPLDPGAGRTAPDHRFEPLERFGLTLRADLEAAVWQVAGPTVQPFPRGGITGEKSKPHALNSAADGELTGVAHAGGRPI